jgi:hypothetical protein
MLDERLSMRTGHSAPNLCPHFCTTSVVEAMPLAWRLVSSGLRVLLALRRAPWGAAIARVPIAKGAKGSA